MEKYMSAQLLLQDLDQTDEWDERLTSLTNGLMDNPDKLSNSNLSTFLNVLVLGKTTTDNGSIDKYNVIKLARSRSNSHRPEQFVLMWLTVPNEHIAKVMEERKEVWKKILPMFKEDYKTAIVHVLSSMTHPLAICLEKKIEHSAKDSAQAFITMPLKKRGTNNVSSPNKRQMRVISSPEILRSMCISAELLKPTEQLFSLTTPPRVPKLPDPSNSMECPTNTSTTSSVSPMSNLASPEAVNHAEALLENHYT